LEFWQESFPEIPFPEAKDVLQILWVPLWPDVDWWLEGPATFQWRWRSSVTEALNPVRASGSRWDMGLVLREGVFDPSRDMDPPGSTLIDYLRTYVGGEELKTEGSRVHERFIQSVTRMFSDSPDEDDGESPQPFPGMKLFGHPFPIQSIGREDVICGACETPMRLLLSTGDRWQSEEPIGLSNLDGMIYLYLCHVCPDRPLRGLFRTG
jgi:hypothetical protein